MFGQWAGAYVAGYWQGGADDARRALGQSLKNTFIAAAAAMTARVAIDYISSDVAATGQEQSGEPSNGGSKKYATLSPENGGTTTDVPYNNGGRKAVKAMVQGIDPGDYKDGRKWGVYEVKPIDENGLWVTPSQKITAAGARWPSNLLYNQIDGAIPGATNQFLPFEVDPNSWFDQIWYHESIINGVRRVLA